MSRCPSQLAVAITAITALAAGCALVGGCAATVRPVDALPYGAATLPAGRAYPQPPQPLPELASDPFYAPPSSAVMAATAPGEILRYRPIAARAYHSVAVKAQAWQLMYRSTDTHGAPVADITSVLVPEAPQQKLLSYQVAYDGLTRRCAPSQELLRGAMIEQLLVSRALRRHWIVVLPDYEGPHSQFAAGINAGHGVLDGLRAARSFLPPTLLPGDAPIALWGYSGGALATLWAGELAADYAPGLPIVALAAGGPPADLRGTANEIDGSAFAGIYFAAVIGLSRAYPAIDTQALLNTRGQAMFTHLQASCVGQELAWVRDPLLSGYGWAQMKHYVTVDDLLAVPAVKQVLDQNQLGRRPLPAPLYYYQGRLDELTPRRDTRSLAAAYCSQGVPVDFAWALGDHITTALTHAGNAVDFLNARLQGQPVANDCAQLLRDAPGPSSRAQ